jgi:hypothetical protein
MTPGEYAKRLGLTLDPMRDAARRYALPWQPGNRLVPVAAMDAAWSRLYRQGKVKTPSPLDKPGDRDEDADGSELEAAKLRRAIADAGIAEQKLAKLCGELVPVAEVTATWTRITHALNGALDSLPAKLAAELPGDPRETLRIARDVVNALRAGLSEQIEAEAAEAEAEAAAANGESDDETEVPPPPTKRKSRAR